MQALVVDDDSVMGLGVIPVGNGFEGMALFLKGFYDVVLAGLEMPGIPVIMVKGDRTLRFEDRWNRSIDAFIFKPFRSVDLRSTILVILW